MAEMGAGQILVSLALPFLVTTSHQHRGGAATSTIKKGMAEIGAGQILVPLALPFLCADPDRKGKMCNWYMI